MESMIRYHLNINPKKLTEDEFAEVWAGLKWILKEQQDLYNQKA